MSLATWVQPPAAHLSTVQEMPSSHEASPQHEAHVFVVAQQVWPLRQSYLHVPWSQRPHEPAVQSPASSHCTCFSQPVFGLQISPKAQAPLSGLLPQLSRAPVHVSLVQATLSSQSLALQQLPQLALVLSAFGQHCSPGPHSGAVVHFPP